MSYSIIPNTVLWLKLEPNPGTNRVASKQSRDIMSNLGHTHHAQFVVCKYEPTISPIQVGRGGEVLTIQDQSGKVIALNAARNTLNLLFTESLTQKSARERGVRKENEFVRCIRSNASFTGKARLEQLCGGCLNPIEHSGTEVIKRPVYKDPNGIINITIKPVRDAIINKHNVSFKCGPEVRLASLGLRGKMGFTDNPSKEGDINRSLLLNSIGISAVEYNKYFGYSTIDSSYSCQVEKLVEQAHGCCIYFHHVSSDDVIVKDYTTIRPVVKLIDKKGTVGGMSSPGNRNVEIKYNMTIDDRPAIVTIMVRVDNKACTRPCNLQIKVKYKKLVVKAGNV